MSTLEEAFGIRQRTSDEEAFAESSSREALGDDSPGSGVGRSRRNQGEGIERCRAARVTPDGSTDLRRERDLRTASRLREPAHANT